MGGNDQEIDIGGQFNCSTKMDKTMFIKMGRSY